MEVFFDDERVTLGDGSISIDQGIHGVQKVAGSRAFVRDPRLSHLARGLADLPPIWKAPVQMAQVAPDAKWCYVCSDVRPKSYFSPKKGTWDGLDPRCKACEAERRRRGYQEQLGRPVRSYVRHEKVAV